MPINYPSESLANKFISESFQDLLQIYGTLVIDGTGSVIFDSANIVAPVSTSYATTASYATSASWAPGSGTSTSSSYSQTSSYALVAETLLGTITSASYAVSAAYAPGNPSISSSYAVTASWAPTPTTVATASYAETASLAYTASSADNFHVRNTLFVGENAFGADQSALPVTFSAPASTGTGTPASFLWRSAWQITGSTLSQRLVDRLEISPYGFIINPDLRPTGYSVFETTRSRPVIYGYGSSNEGTSLRFVQIGAAGGVISYRAEGSPSSLSFMGNNTTISNVGAGGWEGTGWNVNARANIRFSTAESWSTSSISSFGTKIEIQTTQTGSSSTRTIAAFNHDGTFVIGTDPGGSQMFRVQNTGYFGGLVTFAGTATGSFSGSFKGEGSGVTGIESSSYSTTSSLASNINVIVAGIYIAGTSPIVSPPNGI